MPSVLTVGKDGYEGPLFTAVRAYSLVDRVARTYWSRHQARGAWFGRWLIVQNYD